MPDGKAAPLESVTVVDLSELLPGPNATRLLSALGADVIKVERPGGGDRLRHRPGMFGVQNRGKRSIALDLKSTAGRDVLLRLVEKADVFIEGYRPGVLDRLGLGFDDLARINPKLIYVSMSGYGTEGPYRDLPGHDFQYLAFAGAIPAPPAEFADRYTPTSLPIADMGGSVYATLGIVLAIVEKLRDPAGFQGRRLDVALGDCALALMEPRIAEASYEPAASGGALLRPAYGVYRTKDDRYISLGALEDHFFVRLVQAVGLPQFVAPEYADYQSRRARYTEIESQLRPRLESYLRDELIELLISADVPVAPLNNLLEPLDDEHYRRRGMVYDDGTGPRVSEWPTALASFADRSRLTPTPEVGGSTLAILAELGFDAAAIADMVEQKAVIAAEV